MLESNVPDPKSELNGTRRVRTTLPNSEVPSAQGERPPSQGKQIAVVVSLLSDFRVPFYEKLREQLNEIGLNLKLYYGTEEHWSRELDWAEPFMVRNLPGGLTWFPVLSKLVTRSDLVVTEDASRRLINYFLLAMRAFGGPKLVMWGHGWNHQSEDRNTLPERLKRFVAKRADGFMAYTSSVRSELLKLGYDEQRVFDVQNATAPPESVARPEEVEQLRSSLGISPECRVILYCGRIYPMKCIDVLISAVVRVAERHRVHLLIAGGGPSQHIAEAAAARYPFIQYIGPVFERQKAAVFGVSDVLALPGLVGLALVDAFHYRVPPIATELPFHSPEIAYLNDGYNGIITKHDPAELAGGIERMLVDKELYDHLVCGCEESSSKITIDAMVKRFVEGLRTILDEG